MEQALDRFLSHLEQERRLASNTLEAYRHDLDRYLRVLVDQGVGTLRSVRSEHIAALLDIMRRAGLRPSTQARNLSVCRRFHRYLLANGMLEHDPTEGLELPQRERMLPGFLTPEEVHRLLEAPDISESFGLRDRAMLELLYASGLRVSELIRLTLPCLLLDSGLVRVSGRRGRERLVPVSRKALHFLTLYLESGRPALARRNGVDAVFLNGRGGAVSRMTVWKTIRVAAAKVGIRRDVGPHTLRHSFAAHRVQQGASLRIIQELLGHADISTTQVYARLGDSNIADAGRPRRVRD